MYMYIEREQLNGAGKQGQNRRKSKRGEGGECGVRSTSRVGGVIKVMDEGDGGRVV